MNGNEDTLPVTVQHTASMCVISLQNVVNLLLPPSPSGKQALIPSDMALLFVRLQGDSRRRMDHGRQTDSRMHRKQLTN
jgi:hypothetical protein